MVRLFVVTSVLFFPALFAQAGSLQGVVSRAEGGEGVSGALVLVRGTGLVAVSAADGSYSIDPVPNGTYGITCSAPGLRGESTGALYIGDGTVRDFSLQAPGADTTRIYGRANCAGAPCNGAIVTARQGGTIRVSLSDAAGSYSIEAVPAGTYEVRAVAYGFLPASVPDVVIDPPPDGGTMTAREVILDLQAGSRYTVSGVVGLSDNPLERDGSTVRCNGQTPAITGTTTSGGSYALTNVPAGLLSFTASRPEYDSATHIDVLVSSDRTVDFILNKDGGETDPRFSLSGTVTLDVPTDPDGGVVVNPAGTRVSAWSSSQDLRRNTTTDGNGRYTIGGLPPGSYQAGADREGFLPRVADTFQISANRTMDFTLQIDPDYDWGPGPDSQAPACSCSYGSASLGLLVLTLFLYLGLARRRPGCSR